MTLFDILIIVVFIGAIVYGYRKGVITQLGAVGGIIVGIIACRLFGNALAGVFCGKNPDANDIYVSQVFSNVLIFIIGYVGARLIARLIKSVSHALHLNIIDRIAGVLFSLFEWFFIFSLALNIWQAIKPEINVVSYSRLADGRAAAAIMDFAPKVWGSETAADLRNAWDKLPKADSDDDDDDSDIIPRGSHRN